MKNTKKIISKILIYFALILGVLFYDAASLDSF